MIIYRNGFLIGTLQSGIWIFIRGKVGRVGVLGRDGSTNVCKVKRFYELL